MLTKEQRVVLIYINIYFMVTPETMVALAILFYESFFLPPDPLCHSGIMTRPQSIRLGILRTVTGFQGTFFSRKSFGSVFPAFPAEIL